MHIDEGESIEKQAGDSPSEDSPSEDSPSEDSPSKGRQSRGRELTSDDQIEQRANEQNDLSAAQLPPASDPEKLSSDSNGEGTIGDTTNTMSNAASQTTDTTSIFSGVPKAPADPILGLKQKFLADPNAQKVDLSVGVYKNENGQTPKLACVAAAEKAVSAKLSGAYLPIDGLAEYKQEVQNLLFGENSSVIADNRAATVQSVGGTSALTYAAWFLKEHFPTSEVYISDPSWANHRGVFERAGFPVNSYPYYDLQNHDVAFAEMKKQLESLPEQSIVILHGCCHNPTGLDLSAEQWEAVIDIARDKNLVPLIDFAYQGFHKGVDEDAFAIRKFAEANIPFFVANSFSKNFSLYNRRIGALTFVGTSEGEATSVLSQLKRVVRTNNSNPPVDGAAIVSHVLSDATLRQEWETEVGEMRERIVEMRKAFVDALDKRGVADQFRHVLDQNGMFSYSGLSKEQVQKLQDEHSIYAVGSGRICMAALTTQNVDAVAEAIAAVL